MRDRRRQSGFLDAAARLLERQEISVVGVARSSSDGLRCVEALQPDVTLVDIDLGWKNIYRQEPANTPALSAETAPRRSPGRPDGVRRVSGDDATRREGRRHASGRRGSAPTPSCRPTPDPKTRRDTSDIPGTAPVGPGRRLPPPNRRAPNLRSLRLLLLRRV
jgi:hypothetical protein